MQDTALHSDSKKRQNRSNVDGQHIPVDWMHIGLNSRAHGRQKYNYGKERRL